MMSSSRATSSQADGHWAEGHRGAVETEHVKQEVRKRPWSHCSSSPWASLDPAGHSDRGGRAGADLLCTSGYSLGAPRISWCFPVPITRVPWPRRLPCLQRAMKPGKGRPKRRQFVVSV